MKINFRNHKKIIKNINGWADKIFYSAGLIVIIINIYFLYSYCYLAGRSNQTAIELKNQVAANAIDMDRWETTHKNMEWKKMPLNEMADWTDIKNPFAK